MSHPNPSHDRSNEYPEDRVTHYKKHKLKAVTEVRNVGSKAQAIKKALNKKKV